MELLDFIIQQGVPRESAELLIERVRKTPSLVSCEFRGKFIKLRIPTEREKEKMNKMLQSGVTPYLRTDVEFLKGTENGRQFQGIEYQGDAYKESCEKHGGSVKGKIYLHQLAKFPGDPEAWVSGRGDVERVARKRGMGVEGLVDVEMPEIEPPKQVDLAPDILDREVKKALRNTKGMPAKKKAELREAIKDKIAPKKKPLT